MCEIFLQGTQLQILKKNQVHGCNKLFCEAREGTTVHRKQNSDHNFRPPALNGLGQSKNVEISSYACIFPFVSDTTRHSSAQECGEQESHAGDSEVSRCSHYSCPPVLKDKLTAQGV